MEVIILDTNAYSGLVRGDLQIKTIIEEADLVYIPIIVIAELFSGFKNGNREKYNLNLLHQFLSLDGIQICQTTESVAHAYAKITTELKRKGKPIPTNDIWIAAFSIDLNGVLISYDKHFKNISGLDILPN